MPVLSRYLLSPVIGLAPFQYARMVFAPTGLAAAPGFEPETCGSKVRCSPIELCRYACPSVRAVKRCSLPLCHCVPLPGPQLRAVFPAVTLMFVFAIACRRTPPKREPIALRFSIVCGALVPSRSFSCKRVSPTLPLRPFMQKVRQRVRRSKRGFSLPRSIRVDIHAVRMHAEPQKPWWASRDSNPEPTGYEPVALTVAPKALETRLF